MKKNHKLLIIGWFNFPFGSATASRVRTLAKGLHENGFEVCVITTARIVLRSEDHTDSSELYWKGVKYETQNCYERDAVKPSWIKRLCNYLHANLKTWVRVYKKIQASEVDSIMFFGMCSLTLCLPLVLMARFYSISIFYDVVEWFPPSAFKFWSINPAFYDDWLGRYLPLLGSQGVIAITHYISEKYSRYQIPCMIVPSVFDSSQNDNLKPLSTQIKTQIKKDKYFSIIYAGTCKVGDGFENLLDAVKICFSKGCPIYLSVLGTDGLSGLALKQRRVCEEDEVLHSCVNFLGRVSDEEYFAALNSADCLVLPRPDSQIVRAAFPTRLPEFLSTGRPVVTTDVPDIPQYLEGGIHAQIVSGDTSNALAEGILLIWEDPNRALSIGVAGQERGREVFDYIPYAKKISSFVLDNSLVSVQ